MKKNIKPWLIFGLSVAAVFLLYSTAQAQVDAGVTVVNDSIKLGNVDPRVTAARIVQIFLGFLGIIAVSLIIYGGFVWMSSKGESEKIEQAKKILQNAVIGLVIILASWGITTFILSRLLDSTSNGSSSEDPEVKNISSLGLGSMGACVVESAYPPQGKNDAPRNTAIMVTFKEPVTPSSVCRDNANQPCDCSSTCNKLNPEAIQIFRKSVGNSCVDDKCSNLPNTNVLKATVGLSFDQKTIVVVPTEYLGDSGQLTAYTVKFSENILNLRGKSIFEKCQPTYLQWDFSTNGQVDLTPPIVAKNGIFPVPDDLADIYSVVPAKAAIGKIMVNRDLISDAPVKLIGVVKNPDKGGWKNIKDKDVVMSPDYKSDYFPGSKINISVTVNDEGNFQLSGKYNEELKEEIPLDPVKPEKQPDGTFFVDFPRIFSFVIDKFDAGNSWNFIISNPSIGDTLQVGSINLRFVYSEPEIGEALVDNGQQLQRIKEALEAAGWVNPAKITVNNNEIILYAVPGISGNNITFSSNHSEAFSFIPFSGGVDSVTNVGIHGKEDQPLNSVIQINFSEPLNPLTVAGTASQVQNTIRVVNNKGGKAGGGSCSGNSDCLSYKCDNNVCVGNFVSGNFRLSSDYRTLEFLSDNQCGMNGCGEKIYCLPAESNLAVEIMAANLESCGGDNSKCLSRSPFSSCSNLLSDSACFNSTGNRYYPAASVVSMGIMDASLNSFSGNRDEWADGPVSFYNENLSSSLGKDNFRWSFFINSQMITDSPAITFFTPNQGATGVLANQPFMIGFSRLMLNDSLRTGSTIIDNGKTQINHKLFNLRSFVAPVGFWVESHNVDSSTPPDGSLDKTSVNIFHADLMAANSYDVQAGSGLRDIYQNCFKPSAGPNCQATTQNPSCCFNTPINTLDQNGNCQ